MKNNKGFTLVEIISVIGLLLLIATITIPSVISIKNKNKNKNYDKLMDTIVSSAENYYHSKLILNTGESCYITLEDLAKEKLLKTPIINPKTNEKIELSNYVKISKVLTDTGSTELKYEYIDGTVSNLNKCEIRPIINNEPINIVFLADNNTKSKIESIDFDKWKSEFVQKINDEAKYSNVNIINPVYSNSNLTDDSSEYELTCSYSDCDTTQFYGIWKDNWLLSLNQCGFTGRYGELFLVNLVNKNNTLLASDSCKIYNNYILCEYEANGTDYCSSYTYNNEEIVKTNLSSNDCMDKFNNFTEEFSDNTNNPEYIGYTKIMQLLDSYYTSIGESNFWNSSNLWLYSIFKNITIGERTGHIFFTNQAGAEKAQFISSKTTSEFNIEIDNSIKTYFILLTNNNNNYIQTFNISGINENIRNYIYSDTATKEYLENNIFKDYNSQTSYYNYNDDINALLDDISNNIIKDLK